MNAKRLRKLKNLYDLIPKIKCRGKCQHSCTEVALSIGEVKHLYKITRKPIKQEKGFCTYLEGGNCSVYDDRPAVCRMWGVVESLRCPHGCEAERVMTDAEARNLFRQITVCLGDVPGQFVDNL